MDKGTKMKLSIIIPVYNAEVYLRKCLDSILHQTFTDYEVIMVNDGSRDESALICSEYEERDSRFKLINQENAGPGAARNRGLDTARGEYACFIDSDDWIEEDYLASFMDSKYDDVDAIFWGYTENKPNDTVIRSLSPASAIEDGCADIILHLKQSYSFGYTVCCRFRKSIIDSCNLRFFTDIRVHEDACFINMYCASIRSLVTLDMVGYHYMQYTDQSLSRRFFPSDEALHIAQHLATSSEHWFGKGELGRFEVYTYLSKLNLSVMNMYDKCDVPKKSLSERLKRISYVKGEVKVYYHSLGYMLRTTHRIYRFLPAFIIDIIFRMKH